MDSQFAAPTVRHMKILPIRQRVLDVLEAHEPSISDYAPSGALLPYCGLCVYGFHHDAQPVMWPCATVRMLWPTLTAVQADRITTDGVSWKFLYRTSPEGQER